MPTNEIPDYSNYDELIEDIDSNLIEDLVYVDYYNKLKLFRIIFFYRFSLRCYSYCF